MAAFLYVYRKHNALMRYLLCRLSILFFYGTLQAQKSYRGYPDLRDDRAIIF